MRYKTASLRCNKGGGTMLARNMLYFWAIGLLLSGCANRPLELSKQHIQQPLDQPAATSDIPQPIKRSVVLPPPQPGPTIETYSVVVTNVSAQEILFAPPRDAESTITNSTQVNGTGSNGSSGGATDSGNNSISSIKDTSKNRFWETLIQNIKDILHETDKILPSGSSETSVQQVTAASSTGTGVQPAHNAKSANKGTLENSTNPISVEEGGTTVIKRNTFREAASVIANPENGIIEVRANSKQQAHIQEFIDQIMSNAHRQVLIEATIAEVTLNNQYQQGINWTQLVRANGSGIKLSGSTLSSAGSISPSSTGLVGTLIRGNIDAQLALLQTYGNVKVLSSPKLSVLNNQ